MDLWHPEFLRYILGDKLVCIQVLEERTDCRQLPCLANFGISQQLWLAFPVLIISRIHIDFEIFIVHFQMAKSDLLKVFFCKLIGLLITEIRLFSNQIPKENTEIEGIAAYRQKGA